MLHRIADTPGSFVQACQTRRQQQNVEDAVKEMQKPLARYIDDEDLDRMLREQGKRGGPHGQLHQEEADQENKNKKGEPSGNHQR